MCSPQCQMWNTWLMFECWWLELSLINGLGSYVHMYIQYVSTPQWGLGILSRVIKITVRLENMIQKSAMFLLYYSAMRKSFPFFMSVVWLRLLGHTLNNFSRRRRIRAIVLGGKIGSRGDGGIIFREKKQNSLRLKRHIFYSYTFIMKGKH